MRRKRYWPFVRGIRRSPADSPYKGRVTREFLMLSLSYAWAEDSTNTGQNDDLAPWRSCGVTVMRYGMTVTSILDRQQPFYNEARLYWYSHPDGVDMHCDNQNANINRGWPRYWMPVYCRCCNHGQSVTSGKQIMHTYWYGVHRISGFLSYHYSLDSNIVPRFSGLNTLRPRLNGRHFTDDISNEFSWMKMYEYWLKFHWILFPRVQWTISQHWSR